MAGEMRESRETIRIPLVTAESNRIEGTNAAELWAGNQILGTGKKELQYINCYPIYSQPLGQGDREAYVVTRMGFMSSTNYANHHVITLTNPTATYPKATLGFKSLTNCIITAYYDATANKTLIYQLDPTVSSLGFVTGEWNVYLSEINLNNVPMLGIILDNGSSSKGYWVASSAGTFAGQTIAEITDVNFPPKQTPAKRVMGGFVQLNQRVYCITADGYIWNTDANSITSWPTLGFKEVSSSPDQGMSLIRYKHHIVAFGSSSVEFFNDEVDGDSPLLRTDQAFIAFGLASPNSVISIDDTLYWVAKSAQGAQGLWKLDGYTPTLLSQPVESYMLRGGTNTNTLFDVPPSINLQVISMHGMRHIITNLEMRAGVMWIPDTEGIVDAYQPVNTEFYGTPVYCIDTGAWWHLSYSDLDTTNFPSSAVPFRGAQVLVAHNLYTNSQYIHNVGYSGVVPVVIEPSEQSYTYSNGIDWSPANPVGINGDYWVRISQAVMTNILDFGSASRKFVHKASLIHDFVFSEIYQSSLNGVNDYTPDQDEDFYFYFVYTDVDFPGGAVWELNLFPWRVRQTQWQYARGTYPDTIPKTQRLYWNRLGYFRRLRMGFMTNHMMAIRLKAFELEVSKGVH